jgi:hypothetical protein
LVTISTPKGEYRVAVGRDGRYSVDVTAGTYRVTGTSPLYGSGSQPCSPLHPVVTVAPYQDVHVDVLCQER